MRDTMHDFFVHLVKDANKRHVDCIELLVLDVSIAVLINPLDPLLPIEEHLAGLCGELWVGAIEIRPFYESLEKSLTLRVYGLTHPCDDGVGALQSCLGVGRSTATCTNDHNARWLLEPLEVGSP